MCGVEVRDSPFHIVTCTSSACVRECRGGQHCTHLNVAVSSWVIQSDVDTETTAVPDLRGQ